MPGHSRTHPTCGPALSPTGLLALQTSPQATAHVFQTPIRNCRLVPHAHGRTSVHTEASGTLPASEVHALEITVIKKITVTFRNLPRAFVSKKG